MAGLKDKVSVIGMGCTKFGELFHKSREDLIELMDENIFISPAQALKYGLLDKIVPLDSATEDDDPAAFVASSASRMRITAAMREQYQAHVAAQRDAEKDEARRALAHLQALATF